MICSGVSASASDSVFHRSLLSGCADCCDYNGDATCSCSVAGACSFAGEGKNDGESKNAGEGKNAWEGKNYVCFSFLDESGNVLKNSPVCGLTLRSACSMRFRWNESNPGRDNVLANISGDFSGDGVIRDFVPVQLNHTKIVYRADNACDTLGKIGDGIITQNRGLIPTVTVADCVPIYLFDSKTGTFGIVHSGWKGTGIGAEAIKLACSEFCSRAEDFYVVIGPHIKNCCYIVNEERANYFAENFTPDCVSVLENGVSVDWNSGGGKLYRLALDKANVAMFRRAGVPYNHITVYDDCTCCNDVFGSNRRETKAAGKPDLFTVMAAFIAY